MLFSSWKLLTVPTLLLVSPALLSSYAHSWLECTDFRDGKCHGWQRGWSPQHRDTDMTYKLLTTDDVPVCFPGKQDNPTYTDGFPMARASPGQKLTITYLENGHVTKDQLPTKPDPKTFTLHWSPVANVDTIKTRSQLTAANQLGGELPFDDGKCSEDGAQPGRSKGPCQASFTVPSSATPGRHQVVWHWKFNKAGTEEYTACFDVLVTGSNGGSPTHTSTTPPSLSSDASSTSRPSARPSAKANVDQTCNGQHYDPAAYVCDGGHLCPLGLRSCGEACYDAKRYQCCASNRLSELSQQC
ncbi:hypothetical protein THASP1DRAFT_22594 [Thamnocephalis sphaerospora]|uniref:Uncharacterized protein n=1 Tax=Thamnocephalis sphaerospora TaxID=78915 RepID=A0A4V1IX25_9FUNG|nr:hypothetical protein THASP1DRAFT_22594 [Thamnocephalis sphaerospora]|eukprot:RKP09579.1 hypothetical protein THASP1DRAFT_22594 [Thamnocephalis sphaerospora]